VRPPRVDRLERAQQPEPAGELVVRVGEEHVLAGGEGGAGDDGHDRLDALEDDLVLDDGTEAGPDHRVVNQRDARCEQPSRPQDGDARGCSRPAGGTVELAVGEDSDLALMGDGPARNADEVERSDPARLVWPRGGDPPRGHVDPDFGRAAVVGRDAPGAKGPCPQGDQCRAHRPSSDTTTSLPDVGARRVAQA
jgi:hypothetical protein